MHVWHFNDSLAKDKGLRARFDIGILDQCRGRGYLTTQLVSGLKLSYIKVYGWGNWSFSRPQVL